MALALISVLSTAVRARQLSLSHNTFRATWRALEIRNASFNAVLVRCTVTLEGTFHSRTIAKVEGTLIGAVTRAEIARPCVGGEAWTLNGIERPQGGAPVQTLPWPILYESFLGTLPRVERFNIRMTRGGILIRYPNAVGEVACLFEASVARPMGWVIVQEMGGRLTSMRPFEGFNIRISVELTNFCESEIKLGGSTNAFTVAGSTTAITLTLI
jgi:hypothetical protein